MSFGLTTENLELLIDSIIDAVESTEYRDLQVEMVKTILIDNGIEEIADIS